MKWLILVAVLLFVPFLVFSASQWYASRGLEVAGVSCAWQGEDLYTVRLAVRNAEPIYKLASFRVQGRFHPPRGERWPTSSIKRTYASISQWTVFELGPSETAEQTLPFKIPGARRYACDASAWVGRQERFAERPAREVVDSIKGTLR